MNKMILNDYELKQEVQLKHNPTDLVETNQFENNNVACHRKGESTEHVKFRVQRIFSIGHAWYFSTREMIDQGPFISKDLAQKAVDSYILEKQ